MHCGGWVPISKALACYLPHGRPYTKLEAMYCLQLDYDNSNMVTVTGYADLWRWGKGTVIRFLQEIGVKIEYQESTGKKTNQRGLITILKADQNRTNNGLMRLINSKYLECEADQNRTNNGLITDQSRYATIDPNILDPDNTPSSPPRKKKKKESTAHRIPDDFSITPEMRAWFAEQKFRHIEIESATQQFIDHWRGTDKNPLKTDWTATWRNGMRLSEKWEHERAVKAGILKAPTQQPIFGAPPVHEE